MIRQFLFIAALVATIVRLPAQTTDRYYDTLFQVQTEGNVLYGRNARFNGDSVDLKMNIYQPEGDTLPERPLIILAFGGSFTFGSKDLPDITRLCNEFARRGYVTAGIDYRLGFENGNDSDTNQLKALFRGIQDAQAAIRFFYKDRATVNQYKIDTAQIFLGGVSAGAFISLNHAYYREDIFTNPPPVWVEDALNEIDWFTGNSGNPGYSTKVKGVINICGGLADTLWLQPGDPIVISLHGTADDLVPYAFDSAQASQSVEARLFGSFDVHTRATNIGLTSHLKSFYGAGHAPHILSLKAAAYMDTTITEIRDFLYANIERKDLHSSARYGLGNGLKIKVYPIPTDDFIVVDFGRIPEQKLEMSLTDLDGRVRIITEQVASESWRIPNDGISGIFLLVVKDAASGTIIHSQRVAFIAD